MPAQSGNNRNRIAVTALCEYSLLTAICIVFGYIESLLSLSFIAPGIKLGLSNAVALLLVYKKDIKGAFAVNMVRIFLSAFLFGSAVSLVFSVFGGIASLIMTVCLLKVKSVSIIGRSIAGGAVHNLFQVVAAMIFMGRGMMFYIPILLIAGAISGALIGFLCQLLLKRTKLIKHL